MESSSSVPVSVSAPLVPSKIEPNSPKSVGMKGSSMKSSAKPKASPKGLKKAPASGMEGTKLASLTPPWLTATAICRVAAPLPYWL